MLKALKQYIELYHYYGISDFFIESREFKVDIRDASQRTPYPPSQARDPFFRDRAGRVKTSATFGDTGHTTDLALLHRRYANCQKCGFFHSRMKFVYGEGKRDARCMVIGNPPIPDENVAGRPFVGQYGSLFEKMMAAVNLKRQDLYITNITKCRPQVVHGAQRPYGSRAIPSSTPANVNNVDFAEITKCLPYLYEQIDIVKPKILLVFGEVAARALFGVADKGMDYFRGHQGQLFRGIPVYVTYNPLELLQNSELKKLAWVDLQLFRDAFLGVVRGE